MAAAREKVLHAGRIGAARDGGGVRRRHAEGGGKQDIHDDAEFGGGALTQGSNDAGGGVWHGGVGGADCETGEGGVPESLDSDEEGRVN